MLKLRTVPYQRANIHKQIHHLRVTVLIHVRTVVTFFCIFFQTLTVGENTANSLTFKPRPLNLYVVAEDCAPSKENEGILFIRKGQVRGGSEGGSEGGRE